MNALESLTDNLDGTSILEQDGLKEDQCTKQSKRCSRCREYKSRSEFHNNRSKYDGLVDECKICRRLTSRRRYHSEASGAGKEYVKRYRSSEAGKKAMHKARLKGVYGISIQDYEDMVTRQNNKCKICNREEVIENKSLSIDHCHITGEIRGLLCSKCNSILGFCKDNTVILQSAIDYLTNYKGEM